MAHDLSLSLDSFTTSYADTSALLVRDVAGSYRQAGDDEILKAAQCLLASRVRGINTLPSSEMVKNFLKLSLAGLEHEVFAVLHLDSQRRVVEYVEMFRGTASQTSVYPREVVKDALKLNSSAVIFVHNHTSGSAEPSRADEMLSQTLKSALSLMDARVIDHIIVAACSTLSMTERGLL